MIIKLADFSAQTSQSGAPSTYVSDPYVSDYYVVSLAQGWTTTGTPTGGTILIWQKKGAPSVTPVDVIVGSIPLPSTAGQSASVTVPGNSANIAVTVVLTGGTAPAFTGKVIADGQYNDANAGL